VATIIFMRLLADRRFSKESAVSAIFHPFGFLFLFMVVICAIARRIAGTGINWKDRLYNGESTEEEPLKAHR
jgi:hypothetical protein